jgi:hypothetical protein
VKSQASHGLRLGGALLLVAVALAACGRDRTTTPTIQPVTPSFESTAAPTAGPTVEVSTTDAADLPANDAPATPAASYSAPDPANDPVTSDLRSLDQLIDDMNGSLAGANAGGE